MTLLEEIQSKCTPEEIASGEHGMIAEKVSIGRTRKNHREIGNGTILEVLGLTTGNAMLDAINNTAEYRYVKPLIEQGRLIVSSDLVTAAINSLVGASIMTRQQGDSLIAVGQDPAPVSVADVINALKGA